MVNDILDISKIEAGKMDLFLDDFDLDKLIGEVEITSRPLAAKNTNSFIVDRGADPLGMVRLDATKVRQAVLNLISNSAKFTHNGEITLRLRRSTEAQKMAVPPWAVPHSIMTSGRTL
jgi:signal transduction histidine kinase